MTFTPGDTRVCANFDIVNDEVVETPVEEVFTVEIVDVTPDVDTTRQPTTTVTITDDDCEFATESHVLALAKGLVVPLYLLSFFFLACCYNNYYDYVSCSIVGEDC